MTQAHQTLWQNATIATFDPQIDDSYGLLTHHDILVEGNQIIAIAPSGELSADTIYPLQGALITPSLVDCHTHLVFGGSRANEWEQRQNGVSYQDISAQGGGINATVQATRAISETDLFTLSQKRLQSFLHEGVGLIEIKSGYGLDLATEAKTLRVAQQLAQHQAIEISRTLLSAHAIPPEFTGRPDEYMNHIIEVIMPILWQQDLFDCVDVFCENVGFNLAQSERLFQAAQQLGIPIKGHTEQLSLMGGSELVARFQGWSADHVEYLDEQGIQAMAQNGTVATLLPGAFYFLRETQKPPIDLLRQYGVAMAVASDFNPGTSPFASLRLAMNMVCVQFGLTPLEAWQGVTVHAARALRREHDFGSLQVGKPAHFNVWDTDTPVDIVYELGRSFLKQRVLHGNITVGA
ncbi:MULTISPECIES: imidazolonepropionase [Vitreoscilla]|uniref:Imidazolonepropionase n=1 Tax=Vitreoscilla stercoraria TaxID=61 RepID=A0ABY4E6S9_VITST|nr:MULTISPECIES: imidazolonepropionase [Vitreoscilla]AUZ04860.2 imidazolonepropionase [Vitreoscilla sp. C1]UOO91477.1 imidazolonepropionase [Vitreoscilla stercoraria]